MDGGTEGKGNHKERKSLGGCILTVRKKKKLQTTYKEKAQRQPCRPPRRGERRSEKKV